MTSYNFQLTATESTVLNAIANCAIALKTFHTNEIKSGVLAAEVSEAAQTCGVVFLATTSLAGYAIAQLTRQAAIWALVACMLTWQHWADDSKQRAIAQAWETDPSVAPEPVSARRVLAQFIVQMLRLAVWMEQSAIAAYFAYLARWAKVQRAVRNFAC